MTLKVWSCGALVLLAVGAGGCSDPVPAAARGAFRFTITSCQQYTGGVAKNGQVPTVQGFAGDRLVDGEANSNIACTVTSGPPYSIRGSISGNSDVQGSNGQQQATFAGEPVELTINNGQITDTGNGTADITLYAGQAYKSQSALPCTLSVNTAAQMQVASGAVYATFNCASNLDVSSSTTADCSANGVFVFERCEK